MMTTNADVIKADILAFIKGTAGKGCLMLDSSQLQSIFVRQIRARPSRPFHRIPAEIEGARRYRNVAETGISIALSVRGSRNQPCRNQLSTLEPW